MGFGLRTGACEVPSKLACRLCDALLFPSLLRALRLCDALLFPSLLRAATRFSGTAFGLRPALAKYRRNGQPTRIRSEGHGEPVRKNLIGQFGPFLSYAEGRFCPAMLIFGQAGVGLNWTGLDRTGDGMGLGLEWTGMGNGTGLGWG